VHVTADPADVISVLRTADAARAAEAVAAEYGATDQTLVSSRALVPPSLHTGGLADGT
jgi:hypothetical protein